MTAVADDPRADALAVVRRLRGAGHVAYFAGGCVRDELLGLVPKDYDVATDAVPERVRALFGRRDTKAVGAAFGVVLVRSGGSQVEVATFRSDGDYSDGRRPDAVTFTNAEEDARRRDFTINGLFRDPLAQDDRDDDRGDDGVIDFVGGKRDLRDRLLRCIGRPARRFGEDYLRMLRAVRFAARFSLAVHPDTLAALSDLSPRLAAVTPERVGEEVRRMLVPATRGGAWRLLWETGLVNAIFRALPGETRPDLHRPFTRHLAGVPRPIGVGPAVAATAAELLAHAGLPPREVFDPRAVAEATRACRHALRLSNDEADALAGSLSAGPLLADREPSVPTMKRFLAGPHAADARLLLAAAADADPSLADRAAWLEDRFASFDPLRIAPPPLVTGDDLIAAGLRPGPAFKRALDAAYDAQLDGRVTTRAKALAVAIASV